MSSVIEILEKSVQKNISLDDRNAVLLEQFLHSWSNSDLLDADLLRIIRWCLQVFTSFKIDRTNITAALFAMHTLKILLPRSAVEPMLEFRFLIHEILSTLHEIMTLVCFKDSNDSCNRKLIILYCHIHLKCSRELAYLQLLKTYNLWKPLVCFYIDNDEFAFSIQNSCVEYVNNLVLKENTQTDLRLIIEIIDLVAYNTKVKVKINDFNNEVIFRCLKLMDNVLSNHILNQSCGSCRVLYKKCHSLKTQIWQIATNTAKDAIIKYSLKIYTLLEVSTSDVDSNLDQIVHVMNALMEYEKFVPFIPEIFIMFDGFLKKISSYVDFLNFLVVVQVETCSAYFQYSKISRQASLIKTRNVTEKFEKFLQIYRQKITINSHLANVVDSILKTICDVSAEWNTVVRLFLIDFLHSVLKNSHHYEEHKLEELPNILLNVEYALAALLSTTHVINTESNQLYGEILKTVANLITIANSGRFKIRLVAFKICRIIMNRITGMAASHMDALKHAVTISFSDINWEIRDSSLELINEVFLNSVVVNYLLADSFFCESFSRTVIDDESFVRETAYSVLANLVPTSDEHTANKYFNYEVLASETIERFRLESDGNVREKMIMFILRFWQRFKIENTALLGEVFKIMFEASTNDLHSEVRVVGMLFWLEFVRKIEVNDMEAAELFDGLSSVGCLQAIANAVTDEYDPEVKKIASLLLVHMEPFRIFFENKQKWNTHSSNKYGSTLKIENNIPYCIFPKILSCDATHVFVNGENFFKICKGEEIIPSETNSQKIKSIDVEELLDSFLKISCDSKIDEKDCY